MYMPQTFAFCYHAQLLRTVWVAGTEEGDALRLIPAEGESFRYRPRQLLHRWQEDGPPLDATSAPGYLRARVAELEARARLVHLDALQRALTVDEEQSLEQIAAVCARQGALPPGADGWARAALFLALLRDSTRFRRGAAGFAARPESEQQQRAARRTEAVAQEAWAAQARAWAQALEQGQWLGADDPDGLKFLVQLTSLLALEKRSPHWVPLSKSLGLHGLHAHDAAPTLKRWLELAGGWPGWPTIWLLRAGVYQRFAPGLVDLAGSLAAAPPRTAGRTDFQAVPTYTLDAIDTFDYDDAYSILEAGPQGLTVAVHIAEPPPELLPGHPVFDAAAARISSVYTPHGIFPMLPPALSLGRCSLQKGEVREVVTCRLRLSSKGAELAGIERGLIRVTENLDYGRAEELLREQPETWGRLGRLAEALTQARIANGAVVTVRREVSLNLTDPAHVGLLRTSRHGGVHRVIEELAIAYNTAVGRYCREHDLPAIYRAQSKRKSTPEPGITALPMLPPARYTLKGGRHAGLGADRYVHCTSPLRRFPDLVMQRQIVEHAATGRAAFADSALLEEWVRHAESRQTAYDEVERAIDDHWVRVYLSQNPGLSLQATVRRNEHGHGRVWLEDVLLSADAKLPPYARPGGQVTVRVTEVNLDAQRVRVEAEA
jgi:exoribonuclease-2